MILATHRAGIDLNDPYPAFRPGNVRDHYRFPATLEVILMWKRTSPGTRAR